MLDLMKIKLHRAFDYLFELWKILQINSSEYWTVLIHTSDHRIPSWHSYKIGFFDFSKKIDMS
jgi:hypothetical protein